MTIGTKIKEMRLDRGWTRRYLSMLIGFTEQSIINWEERGYTPSERAIRALERAFGTVLPRGGNNGTQ